MIELPDSVMIDVMKDSIQKNILHNDAIMEWGILSVVISIFVITPIIIFIREYIISNTKQKNFMKEHPQLQIEYNLINTEFIGQGIEGLNLYDNRFKTLKCKYINYFEDTIKRVEFTIDIYNEIDEIVKTITNVYTGYITNLDKVEVSADITWITPISKITITKVRVQFKDSDKYIDLDNEKVSILKNTSLNSMTINESFNLQIKVNQLVYFVLFIIFIICISISLNSPGY